MIIFLIVYAISVAISLHDTYVFHKTSTVIKNKDQYTGNLIKKTLHFFITLSFIPGLNTIVSGFIIISWFF
jgi:hypothetical protein